jgi:cbb3-type cytochrome oxidase subunit 1
MATLAQAASTTAPAAANAPRAKLSPAEMFEQARVREISLSRLVMAFVSAGLVFMLLPGTFLGVWNLIQISGRASVAAISPAWIQAHGHAQVFGWIGSFILGIGFYSVPKLRGTAKKKLRSRGGAGPCGRWASRSAGSPRRTPGTGAR